MGNELSCPCSEHYEVIDKSENQNGGDIIDEVMKGKLPKEEILFEYSCKNDIQASKVCLISTANIDGFFSNRNLLIIETKHDINYYYNKIIISNYLAEDSVVFIILQYSKGQEDRSTYYSKSQLKKTYKPNDYNALYKSTSINFISVEKEKIEEQLLMDLYSQLKKEYRFYGIIADSLDSTDEITKSFSYSKPRALNNYRILYKKSKLTDNLDIKYALYIHTGRLSSDIITEILLENKTMTLKGVIKQGIDSKRSELDYYFIFEGNKVTPEYDESDFLVAKVDREKSSADSFMKDIAEKVNYESNAKLLTIINDKNCFYLIFKYDFTDTEDS